MKGAAFLIVGAVLALAALHAWSYAPFLSDDALISLRYADRLLAGHGLTWTDGERVEGYTDLAWVLLTAFLGLFRIDLIVAARALGCLGAGAAVVFASLTTDRPARLSIPRALTGGLMLALSGPLAVWAIGALEHGFQAGVLVTALWLVMRQQPGEPVSRRDTIALGALLVLLALLRADGAVLIGGVLLGNLLREVSWRSLKRSIAWGLPPLGALLFQLAFRRVYYEAWVPNTALVKASSFNLARLKLGLHHLEGWLGFGWLLLVAVALALVAQERRERRWIIPLVTSVLWTGYLATVGGDIFPAWRQLLLGLVPLALVISEGGQRWWERAQPKHRAVHVAMAAGWVLLAGLYFRAQQLDPQNRRGHEERWEFDGYALGPWMREAWGPLRPLLAVDAAGALPYFSGLPSLDLLGLNDRWIATHPPPGLTLSTGHELGDGAYTWQRKPDILAMCGAGGGRDACFLGGKQVLAHPEFHQKYQLIRYHSRIYREQSGDLWVRREDGPLGIQRSADRIVVPGWLLTQHSGVAELHEGKLKAFATPERPAHLSALQVPAGRWKLRAANAQIGVLCEGRSVPRSAGELVLDVSAPARIDLLVGAPQPVFIDQLTLERTDEPATARCDPATVPTALEIDAAQLSGRAPKQAYFLQPLGLKLTRGLPVTITLTAGARRYELSVDGNDRYRLRFMRADGVLGVRLVPDVAGPGLSLQQLDVPPETERLEVVLLEGDGVGSIGHLTPISP